MPYMTRIPSDLARFGLTVELVPGWETRGSSSFAPGGVTCHWTAGPKNAADQARPSLNVCINGRPGIPGPLCNIYLARDGTCVVVAAGRANHAGVGGFRGLVGNSAVYGIEAECGGDGDWSKHQLKFYPRLVAALLSGIGRDASWAHGHSEWAPSRKIDIRDIMPSVRSAAAAILANPETATPEDDMPLTNDDVQRVAREVWSYFMSAHDGLGPTTAENFLKIAAVEARKGTLAINGGNPPGRSNFHWLAEQIVSAVTAIPGSEVHVVEQAIAKAVNDEADRRERERLSDDAA